MEGPLFGGKPGEPVPQVDLEDFDDSSVRSGQAVATGADLLRQVCKPGADVEALSYRAMMLSLLTRHTQEQLAPWNRAGKLDDVVLRTAAKIPMQWIGVGIEHRGLPFDVEDFMRGVRG
jgi:hypothetical protein